MTLQTLTYVLEIAKRKSFSQTAKALFLSQSALSTAVKELEEELGIQLFVRSNRGVVLTTEGEDFIKYAKDIVDRSELLALRYQTHNAGQTMFSVSAQHLPFAVRAFQKLMDQMGKAEYTFAMKETSLSNVLYEVSTGKSQVGILAFPKEHLELLQKSFASYNLSFTEMAELTTYVFLRRKHPLAERDSLRIEELEDYPFVTYDSDSDTAYHTEEALILEPLRQTIHVSDRATKMLLLRSTDAFSIGADLPNYNRDIYFRSRNTELRAVPLQNAAGRILTGYLKQTGVLLPERAEQFLELLQKEVEQLHLPTGQKEF
ncbi:MAG: LysR family transcriptional regulator [Eubacteriales bacterium]|nr:LysR family transcriptional regulator [Eubacteriales bacterium]